MADELRKNVVVFAGSECAGPGKEGYEAMAYELGGLLGAAGCAVVTGAGPGLMDACCRGAQSTGGKTIGIGLDLPGRHQSLFVSELEVISNLGPRQEHLLALGDAYVALPGGVGTFYEVLHVLALKRVGELPAGKPLVLIGEYFSPLITLLGQSIAEGFMPAAAAAYCRAVASPAEAAGAVAAAFAAREHS